MLTPSSLYMSYHFYRYGNVISGMMRKQVCIRNLLQLVHLRTSTCTVSTVSAKVCLWLPATSSPLYKPTVAILCHCCTSWVHLKQKSSHPLKLPREPGLPSSGQERNLVHWLLGIGIRVMGTRERGRKGSICKQLTPRAWFFTSITKNG